MRSARIVFCFTDSVLRRQRRRGLARAIADIELTVFLCLLVSAPVSQRSYCVHYGDDSIYPSGWNVFIPLVIHIYKTTELLFFPLSRHMEVNLQYTPQLNAADLAILMPTACESEKGMNYVTISFQVLSNTEVKGGMHHKCRTHVRHWVGLDGSIKLCKRKVRTTRTKVSKQRNYKERIDAKKAPSVKKDTLAQPSHYYLLSS